MRQISATGWHFEIVLVNDSVSSHLYYSFPGKGPVMMERIKMASKAAQIAAVGLGAKPRLLNGLHRHTQMIKTAFT